MAGSPTVRRRRLAADLRGLREHAGLTIEEAAAAADISKSALSRIENALVTPRIPVMRALARAYKVDEERSNALIQLARDAGQRGWWQAYGDVLTYRFATFIGFEAEARFVRGYNPLVVAGLLQTRDYSAAMFEAFKVVSSATDEQRERYLDARMKRQERLGELELWWITDEQVLRRSVGGREVMRGQLERLLDASAERSVTIQVVPAEMGLYLGLLGSFSVLEFPEETDRDIGYIETMGGEVFLDTADEVRRLGRAFDYLMALALDPVKSRALIQTILKEER